MRTCVCHMRRKCIALHSAHASVWCRIRYLRSHFNSIKMACRMNNLMQFVYYEIATILLTCTCRRRCRRKVHRSTAQHCLSECDGVRINHSCAISPCDGAHRAMKPFDDAAVLHCPPQLHINICIACVHAFRPYCIPCPKGARKAAHTIYGLIMVIE